ncbi:MAG: hypothetical protein A3C30_03875 [Candidatus Levybacteria bacterium RIFCSPHIGHO2_02_FULL_40_18]|nr:MAG: hypothetical protein A2869_00495 [Candidatus Levybacteria bacterium RIFCSPHIGHO2_01_FULL_40_58]OGH26224.1 MAG: hypothetical protein A3C30_03875 [Candidatus Levybacteria bacterium RIFCSPHIGHO2_02_FULL_40_18]OGH31476.1 MAG: hypothetical protein A3E43_02915 [Candidatus Levybacteria bacterium RIFCSPHIGHO2_12_FULL_40_31]OGH40116.1 MAG: hypothetical protein A2894_04235 [Candidatus Levybacteria bacterium RIFCSPLOWO2_01_FULL_40_64]OGH49069.1 MAG: hypothetical protein A3I54_00660 [Candidatus Lev
MIIEPSHFESLYPKETRKAEIAKIIEFVSSGKSCQVIGLPGTGKSNALRLLPYNRTVRELHLGKRESSYHFVYMDFSEVAKRSLSDILKFILISIASSFGERRLKEEESVVNKFLSDALKFSDEMVFSQNLKKAIDYLANECELNIVFLLDRFEEYVQNIDSSFFLNLKILRNRAKYRFTAVFGITRPIEEVLESSIYAEFSEFLIGNIVYLSLYDKVGLEFRFKHLEEISGKSADERIKSEIIKLTGGHGKLARICYEATLANSQQPTANSRLSEVLLLKPQVRSALSEIWNFLTPEEKKDIKANNKNEFLEKAGLTRDGKLVIPLFDTYLKTLTPTSPRLSYDQERNEILKGDQNLTEILSPQEFRLLRFLLQNQGRVCEKDEIISNVWKDTKTQEGVTDQALDQIIYRLRKKIEDDPNNPNSIQTIKGRGYKLTE